MNQGFSCKTLSAALGIRDTKAWERWREFNEDFRPIIAELRRRHPGRADNLSKKIVKLLRIGGKVAEYDEAAMRKHIEQLV